MARLGLRGRIFHTQVVTPISMPIDYWGTWGDGSLVDNVIQDQNICKKIEISFLTFFCLVFFFGTCITLILMKFVGTLATSRGKEPLTLNQLSLSLPQVMYRKKPTAKKVYISIMFDNFNLLLALLEELLHFDLFSISAHPCVSIFPYADFFFHAPKMLLLLGRWGSLAA